MICFGRNAFTGAHIRIQSEGGALQSVEELINPGPSDMLLAPGFIDLQVNGYAGVDYCAPGASLEEIDRSIRVQFSTGVTRIFPTVITGGPDTMLGAIKTLAAARRELRYGRALEGFHIEGPHIHPADGPRGAHPLSAVRPPDIEEFKRWQDAAEGNIRIVTLSPHWPEAPAYIEFITGQGVVASIGHLDATKEQIEAAISAGATMSTHLGNGAHFSMQRHPNYIWHQLAEDRLNASFIGDGIHLDGSFLKVALRAKGIERSVLITDAVMPAGCAPGDYMLGEVPVTLHPQGKVTLRTADRLAGSALRMDHGIEVLMRLCGVSLAEALTMATRNPARAGRVSGRQRGLEPGERADVVAFDFDAATKSIHVRQVWLDGEEVFSAN